jgi:hypothetical protein
MRAFVRKSLLIASASAIALPALAGTSGVYLPPAPTGSGGEDSIETSSGTRCRQSINSSGAYLDVGVSGQVGSNDRSPAQAFAYHDDRAQQGMAYARVTVPLGHKPTRIDCSKVYELELARLQREVELLKLGVN